MVGAAAQKSKFAQAASCEIWKTSTCSSNKSVLPVPGFTTKPPRDRSLDDKRNQEELLVVEAEERQNVKSGSCKI
jgi:hypothetical protein